jgi:hypothetical protein
VHLGVCEVNDSNDMRGGMEEGGLFCYCGYLHYMKCGSII